MKISFIVLAVLFLIAITSDVILLIKLSGGQPFLAQLNQDSHLIGNITSLISAFASLFVIIALAVAILQLRQNQQHARAQSVYAALKDVRELPEDTNPGDRFNLYYAMFEQKRHGVWDKEMWGPVEADIQATLNDGAAGSYWEKTKSNYTKAFQTYVESIRKQSNSQNGSQT